MTEEHRSEAVDLGAHDRLEAREQVAVLAAEALRDPGVEAPDRVLAVLRADAAVVGADELAIGVAHHPADAFAEPREAVERLARQRAGRDVAADDDELRRGRLDLGEHRLERVGVAVDVVQRGDAH